MTMSHNRLTLDEVLDEFFYASEKPNAEKLKEVLVAYPEYRDDIVEFTALWASYENSEQPAEAMVSSAVSPDSVARLQSFVMERLYELDHGVVGNASTKDVDAAKKVLKTLAGSALRRAADGAGFFGSSILLTKILTNSISQVPKRVIDALAAYLCVSSGALSAALGQGGLGVARSYKSSDKPSVQQAESWESAINALTLTPEQKHALLAMADKE